GHTVSITSRLLELYVDSDGHRDTLPGLSQPQEYSPLTPLTPPPPGSTLFPYTTLFRSPRDGRSRGTASRRGRRSSARPRRTSRGDRKSTRLNSSHVAISYAVFCLKKNTRPVRAVVAPVSQREAASLASDATTTRHQRSR